MPPRRDVLDSDDEYMFDDSDSVIENESDEDFEFQGHDDDNDDDESHAPAKPQRRGRAAAKSSSSAKSRNSSKSSTSRTKQKQSKISFPQRKSKKSAGNDGYDSSTGSDHDINDNGKSDDDFDLVDDDDDEHGEFENYAEGEDGRAIEEIYQKKSQLEHILLRPDTYIGSTDATRMEAWVYDQNSDQLLFKKITIVPGLYKIFDEILVNAADNKIRSKEMNKIKVTIDQQSGTISVWNNGKGIPVEMHKEQNMYVPTLIFGHLLTGSNFDDDMKKVTGGRNGYGAKLANIFSKEFIVETVDATRKRKFRQVWRNNMSVAEDPKITSSSRAEEYTMVTFKPDLSKFKMDKMDDDIVSLMMKRVYDVAGTTAKDVTVWLNGKRLPIKTFRDYVNLYVKKDKNQDKPLIYEDVNERWSIGISISDGTPQQVSFVNSICTTKGGKHVQYIADQVAKNLLAHIQKRNKSTTVRLAHIKNHLSVFVNALIINPAFDSQTKETLTTNISKFGSRCKISDDFMKKVFRCGIVNTILSFAKYKENSELSRRASGSKKVRLHDVAKLDDANDAGSRHSHKCTLILTEGDSAKALAISGLSVVGRDRYGVFPLKGKPLNVRDASGARVMKNEELSSITKIIGLKHGEKYDASDIKKLRYGSVMIMADQDHDGSHIKGLLLNFIHKFWPSLLRVPGFVKEFITPIVRATNTRTKQIESFFTIPEYESWKESIERSGNRRALKQWNIKYYKGLGTSTAQEAREYFSNLQTHQIQFAWDGETCEQKLLMAFQKDKVEERKQWINQFEEGTYIDHSKQNITVSEFIDKELILFSIADNIRSIPSVVDGLKPGQRKILYSCFKRNLKKEIKVAQLAGYVSEHSAYHHGEQSLNQTIIKMAQDFVGTNNINLLYPSGQFGTRLQGGNDSASPRYVFTRLNEITRTVFSEHDDRILEYLDDDGMPIEPKFYVPIIPMVLVNGAEGIGSGWSTKVPQYNPRDLIDNIRRILDGNAPIEMHPWYRGFKGEISFVRAGRWETKGILRKIDDTTIEITELPVGVWTQNFKEMLVDMMEGSAAMKERERSRKNQRGSDRDDDDGNESGRRNAKKTQDLIKIEEFRENHTNTDVHFTIFMSEEDMANAEAIGLEKVFKLTSTINTTNMTLFSADGRITKYDRAEDILMDFYRVRLEHYDKRKQYLVDKLSKEFDILDNKVRFILAVVNEEIVVRNKKKAELLKELAERGFTPYSKDNIAQVQSNVPAQEREALEEDEDESDLEDDALEGVDSKKIKKSGVNVNDLEASSYNYLLSMPLWSLTMEKVKELETQRNNKLKELEDLRATSIEDLWRRDLDILEQKIIEAEEMEEHARSEETKKTTRRKSAASARNAKRKTKTTAAARKPKVEDEDEYVPSTVTKPSSTKKSAPLKKKETEKESMDTVVDPVDIPLPKVIKPAGRRKKQVTFTSDTSDNEGLEPEMKPDHPDSDSDREPMSSSGVGRTGAMSLLDKVMQNVAAGTKTSGSKASSTRKRKTATRVAEINDDVDPEDIFELSGDRSTKHPSTATAMAKKRKLQPASKKTGIASYFSKSSTTKESNTDEDTSNKTSSRSKGRITRTLSRKSRTTTVHNSDDYDDDDDDDDDDGFSFDKEESREESVQPRGRPTRTRRTAFARAAKQSIIDISDDEDDDHDDDSDEDFIDEE